ncbi:MAG TPA: PilZ domain-containing protein [Terracidiphilus sp.]|nr:PilZ domain-containing protein [Terracidiphilus sp.]
MESRTNCAYNQTRECFLGLEVSVADTTMDQLKARMESLELKSGEGLWLSPFRGIPDTGLLFPLDLLYLDADLRVLDAVESFPTFHASTEKIQPASVLALPAHAIYSSQSQAGDQLVICPAEEMERNLERFSNASSHGGVVQSAVLLREKPLWSGGPGVLQLEEKAAKPEESLQPTHEMVLMQPGDKTEKPPKSWLERFWSPDPRRAPRDASPRLAAYYWTGAAPQAHNVRDISSTGLYVVTEERWYPGTLVLMTLQRTDDGEELSERSIAVMSRAVRWGEDGVGLQFILPKAQDTRRTDGVDRKTLEKFLQGLRKRKH